MGKGLKGVKEGRGGGGCFGGWESKLVTGKVDMGSIGNIEMKDALRVTCYTV